jgi:hypothetical protein
MSVSAVDVGLHNMGIVTILPDRTPSFALRVNIQESGESRLGRQVERTLYDNMHNLGEHVVIERQPPLGMQAIMELLIYILEGAGKSVSLVNPNTLHKYYRMPEDYEDRKERSVVFALGKGFGSLESFAREDRQHDMADAALMAYHHADRVDAEEEARRVETARRERLVKVRGMDFHDLIETFRFRG